MRQLASMQIDENISKKYKNIKNFIYKITNLKNNKIYIGQSTKTIDFVLKRYLKEIKYNKKIRLIIRAMKKYKIENFKFEVIEICQNSQILNEKEIFWIVFFDSNNNSKGYNLTIGGGGTRNLKWNSESKKNASIFWSGKRKGKNNPFYGKVHTQEVKNIISESNKKRIGEKKKPMSLKTKQNISKSKLGKKVNSTKDLIQYRKNHWLKKKS